MVICLERVLLAEQQELASLRAIALEYPDQWQAFIDFIRARQLVVTAIEEQLEHGRRRVQELCVVPETDLEDETDPMVPVVGYSGDLERRPLRRP